VQLALDDSKPGSLRVNFLEHRCTKHQNFVQVRQSLRLVTRMHNSLNYLLDHHFDFVYLHLDLLSLMSEVRGNGDSVLFLDVELLVTFGKGLLPLEVSRHTLIVVRVFQKVL